MDAEFASCYEDAHAEIATKAVAMGSDKSKCVSTLALSAAFSTETLDTTFLKKTQGQILLGRTSENVGTVLGL